MNEETMIPQEETHAGEVGDFQAESQPIEGAEQESGQNWEQSAKYFQAEKDKLYSENQRLIEQQQALQSNAEIGQFVRDNPHLINNGQTQQQTPQRIEMNPDDFDSHEAFTNPNSDSYKWMQQQQEDRIQNEVNRRMQGINQQVTAQNIKTEAISNGLNQSEANQFMEFLETPANKYSMDQLIGMFRSINGDAQNSAPNNTVEQARKTQNLPQSAGVLQGQKPVTKSNDDQMWDRIMGGNASSDLTQFVK